MLAVGFPLGGGAPGPGADLLLEIPSSRDLLLQKKELNPPGRLDVKQKAS